MTELGSLETQLREARAGGRKLLVPYVTGGLSGWSAFLSALAVVGADAVEVGLPFSDPVMDGPTIQRASERALESGANPPAILDGIAVADVGIPVAVMTYYNLVFRAGHERFAKTLAASGVTAAIVPDLPLEEVGPWASEADRAGIETVMLAAPTAPDERLPRICERARGFVYAVGLLGVTGERSELAASATVIARRLKQVTDKPVLVGVGISTPQQAVEACTEADGVVVGSALMSRLLAGASTAECADLVGSFRAALDHG